MLYRGTQDGFNTSHFYKLCFQAAPSIMIVKSDQGKIFGGYTNIPWSSDGREKIGNGQSFVFSIRDNNTI